MDESPLDSIQRQATKSEVVEVLRTVFDPEIPVNIYDLGLIYDVHVGPDGKVDIRMTLTSPACPVAGTLPPEVEARVKSLAAVSDAKVDLVWEPPWTPDRMTEAAKLQLNMEADEPPSRAQKFFGIGRR
ncbi:MAG: DUF59 domain-containing protein [Planctomycetes bacterium]|nr:DUF59 domain-containing protein [Planctomycetota bacterium]